MPEMFHVMSSRLERLEQGMAAQTATLAALMNHFNLGGVPTRKAQVSERVSSDDGSSRTSWAKVEPSGRV